MMFASGNLPEMSEVDLITGCYLFSTMLLLMGHALSR